MGLVDRRRGTLNQQAAVLVGLTKGSRLQGGNTHAKKIARLRKLFQTRLGIKNDPFERYQTGRGWVPRFGITDKRGAADLRARKEGERRAVQFDDEKLIKPDPSLDHEPTIFEDEDDAAGKWLKGNDPKGPA